MLILTAGLLDMNDAGLKELIGQRRNAEIVADPTAATRWVPPTDLRELLRLLLHFPDAVSTPLADADPDIVTPREDVKWAIGQLLSGAPLTAVLDEISESDLAWWLQSLAADQGPETSETAAAAGERLLERLEHRNLEGRVREMTLDIQDIQKRLPALKHQLTDDEYAAEMDAWRTLIKEKLVLQKRVRELRTGRNRR